MWVDKKKLSWGRRFQGKQSIRPIYWSDESVPGATAWLPSGRGNAFGDSGLCSNGQLLSSHGLNRILKFDPAAKTVRCGSGVSLSDLIAFLLERGHFLYAVPNSGAITVGGALAADAHGRNQVRYGNFGNHIKSFELVRSDGRKIVCSPEHEAELFHQTIGGFGLTGLVTWIEISVRSVESHYIEGEVHPFSTISQGIGFLSHAHEKYEYTSLWIDPYSRLGSCVAVSGNHSSQHFQHLAPIVRKPLFTMKMDLPRFMMSRTSVRLFNAAYFRSKSSRRFVTPLVNFLFTLDAIGNWNRLFGRKGFLHFHYAVPKHSIKALLEIVESIRTSDEVPALSILKSFGSQTGKGALSFPIPGFMLATDFKYRGPSTIDFFQRMEEKVVAAGGRIYLAKDSVMMPESFERAYPRWRDLDRIKDPRITSDQWERLTAKLK